MSQKTVNPYPDLATQYASGLDYIMVAMPGVPSIVNLVKAVCDYTESVYYPAGATTQQKMEMTSVAYSAINSYIAGLIRKPSKSVYNGNQHKFVGMMVGRSIEKELPVDAIDDRILDIENNITKSGLTVLDQTPLLMATEIGSSNYKYWLNQIALGGASAWLAYINAAKVSAMGNIPIWTSTSMEGALIGANLTPKGMIETTEQIVTTEIISSLISALTVTAGRVIFDWVPKVEFSLLSDSNKYATVLLPNNVKIIGEETYVSRISNCSDKSAKIFIYRTDDGGAYYHFNFLDSSEGDLSVCHSPDLPFKQEGECFKLEFDPNLNYFIIPFDHPSDPLPLPDGPPEDYHICCDCVNYRPESNIGDQGQCFATWSNNLQMAFCNASYQGGCESCVPDGQITYKGGGVSHVGATLTLQSRYLRRLPVKYYSLSGSEQLCNSSSNKRVGCEITIYRNSDGSASYNYIFNENSQSEQAIGYSPDIPFSLCGGNAGLRVNLDQNKEYFVISFDTPEKPLKFTDGGFAETKCKCCGGGQGACELSTSDDGDATSCSQPPGSKCWSCGWGLGLNISNGTVISGGFLLVQATNLELRRN